MQWVNNQGVTFPKGFKAQGVECAIKKPGVLDLAVIAADVPCAAAGVLTTNKVQAACVQYAKQILTGGKAQAVVINAGNANACTGGQGLADNLKMTELTAAGLGLKPQDVLVASTGVIGVNMPMDRVAAGIAEATKGVSVDGWENACHAIMTTDTVPKVAAVEFALNGKTVRMAGMAKGSGMIHPNMATMLGFVTTDAAISAACLQQAMKDAVAVSFNMISVDGDTSTNDMCLILANGLAGNDLIDTVSSADYQTFKEALDLITIHLAKAIARDGEGATRLIEVTVNGAMNELEARKAARGIVASSLFKSAVFGEDANWGRIICAAGYSGAEFDPALVDIYLGSQQMARGGMGIPFDEDIARKDLGLPVVKVVLDFKQGAGQATAWGCDLTYDYVKINASYRS